MPKTAERNAWNLAAALPGQGEAESEHAEHTTTEFIDKAMSAYLHRWHQHAQSWQVVRRYAQTALWQPLSDRDFTAIRIQFSEPTAATQVQQTIADVLESTRALAAEVVKLRDALRGRRTMFLASLGSDTLRLRFPLPVEVFAEAEVVVAHSPDLEIHGSGESEYDALEDLRTVLAEEYKFLNANEGSLGPGPASQRRRFRELVEELG